ncbi:neuronal acetylcholine receptor subunit alpha-3 isoform X1 [Hydra vulgaris]|uniref:neuronal acetylcholine receptor subunit alpha-3 isoform X1 n=1 Tax=Hydra vulgaris TaxID=6087 RepID=UPI000641076D|nr:neuronal acetylcholine receptor subunit alpha-3 [Hydra vulgaris]XP_047140451.1 neuronal acetylcholine receptor subunit alpha-3 [Hydra vulgaris]
MLFKVVIVNFLVLIASFPHQHEEKLFHDLFETNNYNPSVRPVVNDKDTVNVTFGLILCQLVDVQEKKELLVLSTLVKQIWQNPFLKWHPEKYSNISVIHIDPSKVWKPDIVLYNNAGEDRLFGGNLETMRNRIILDNTGVTTWITPLILTSKCDMDVKYFPFDTQRCPLKFGSWTHDKHRLNIINESPSAVLEKFANHTEWYLVSAGALRSEQKYICCPELYPDVTYTIELRRRSLFYVCNLIFPLIVISLLPILSFILPASSGERISLVFTILLSLTVFMTIVAGIIPDTSDSVPLVSIFYLSVLFEMVIMILILCYIMTLHHKAACDPPMPNWMRRYVLNWLSYLLHVNEGNLLKAPVEHKLLEKQDLLIQFMKNIEKKTSGASISKRNSFDPQSEVFSNIPDIFAQMDSFKQAINDKECESNILKEWKIVAMTLDRCALLCFASLYLLTIIGCFSLSPGYAP